jgi:hypothetical protein
MTAATVAQGLVLAWAVLLVAIGIACYREAREADRREALLDARFEGRSLREYSAREQARVASALPVIPAAIAVFPAAPHAAPHTTTAGAPGEASPAAVTTTNLRGEN